MFYTKRISVVVLSNFMISYQIMREKDRAEFPFCTNKNAHFLLFFLLIRFLVSSFFSFFQIMRRGETKKKEVKKVKMIVTYAMLMAMMKEALSEGRAPNISVFGKRPIQFSENMPKLMASDLIASGVIAHYCVLDGSYFEDAHLEGANFEGASLIDAHMNRANLDYAKMNALKGKGVFLEGAHLLHANLVSSDLTNAQMGGASMKYADLRNAVLSDSVLTMANLAGAILIGATCRGTDFRHADLQGTDFSHADLRGADLTDAVFDEETIFEERHIDEVVGLDFDLSWKERLQEWSKKTTT